MRLIKATTNWIAHAWDTLHIEHKGFFSLERLQLLRRFTAQSNVLHNTVMMLGMPLPTLSVSLLSDCIPLAPPSAGAMANYAYWARAWIIIASFTLGVFSMVHYCCRSLPQSWPRLLTMTAIIATLHVSIHFGLSVWLGFPIPFGYLVMNVPWISMIMIAMWIHMGRACRANAELKSDLKKFTIVVYVSSSLAVTYPLFYHLFLLLKSNPTGQFFFTFVLPGIKLVEKWLLNHFSTHMEDLQPTLATFNVEVFNALFVSCCMQNANSLATSIALMSLDFFGASYALHKLQDLMSTIDELSAKMGVERHQMLDVATTIIQHNPNILLWHRTPISIVGFPNRNALAGDKIRRAKSESNVPPADHAPIVRSFPTHRFVRRSTFMGGRVAPTLTVGPDSADTPGSPSKIPSLKLNAVVPSTASTHAWIANPGSSCKLVTVGTIERLSMKERKKFVKESLKVLRRTEFLLLVEYTEVIVPFIYSESLLFDVSVCWRQC